MCVLSAPWAGSALPLTLSLAPCVRRVALRVLQEGQHVLSALLVLMRVLRERALVSRAPLAQQGSPLELAALLLARRPIVCVLSALRAGLVLLPTLHLVRAVLSGRIRLLLAGHLASPVRLVQRGSLLVLAVLR